MSGAVPDMRMEGGQAADHRVDVPGDAAGAACCYERNGFLASNRRSSVTSLSEGRLAA